MISQNIELKKTEEGARYPLVYRIPAKIISIIFHPLFIPLYVAWFLIYDLYLFAGSTGWEKTKVFISFFVNYTLLPLVTILLMRALGFIQSVFLKTQKDRILPYVVCQIYYFWGWYVAKNNHLPQLLVLFGLAVFLASCLGLLFNIYLKISMHALSLGVISALAIIIGMRSDLNLGFYIALSILAAGITCTARLIDSNHSTKEIYIGFLVGVFAQVVSCLFV